jgi:hypothetical protein
MLGQTVIGGENPDSSAILDLQSDDKGFLLPRLTTEQRNAILHPATGLKIYNISKYCIEINHGNANNPDWVEVGCKGLLSSLKCSDYIYTPGSKKLIVGEAADRVIVSIPYEGSNGWTFPEYTTQSYGVAGLTISVRISGVGILLNFGEGSLTARITGTPSQVGMAHFDLNIGGQMCTLSIPVSPPAEVITSLECSSDFAGLSFEQGVSVPEISRTITYEGGNGASFTAQDFMSTGVTGLILNIEAGQLALGNGLLPVTISGTPQHSGVAGFDFEFAGKSCRVNIPVLPNAGLVAELTCSNPSHTGTLLINQPSVNTSTTITYLGGNGGFYPEITIPSVGVEGLVAQLSQGYFQAGNGLLIFNITGTPTSSGLASFTVNIGGKSCTFERSVDVSGDFRDGTVFCATENATSFAEILNPNTNRIWMDRNLGASRVATSFNDEASFGDLYQWGRGADGHQCRNSSTTTVLSSTDIPGHGDFIVNNHVWPYNWRTPINENLWQGVNGVNNPCPENFSIPTEAELAAEMTSLQITNILTAYNSPLKISSAGKRVHNGNLENVGTMTFFHTSTFNAPFSRTLFIDQNAIFYNTSSTEAFSIRCIKENPTQPVIQDLLCEGVILTGSVIKDELAQAVQFEIPYDGGNGGSFGPLQFISTGVAGLVANLNNSNLAYGHGKLKFVVTGIAANEGMASFNIIFGEKTCLVSIPVYSNPSYPTNSTYCSANGPTEIVEVLNPLTNKIWMDRNLGASRTATAVNDVHAYGDLYQWGRGADGHQCRNSATTTNQSSTDVPGHPDFIVHHGWPHNWRSQINENLWQGVNGINNPCPQNFRIPTEAELLQEIISLQIDGSSKALNSILKIPGGGIRLYHGGFDNVGTSTYLHTSTLAYPFVKILHINQGAAFHPANLGYGVSIRCLKESPAEIQIESLNCNHVTQSGSLIAAEPAQQVYVDLPYTGGNGGQYVNLEFSSTGITGLTASLNNGTLINGNGSLRFFISGTPGDEGIASFNIQFNDMTCAVPVTVYPNMSYPPNSIICNSNGPTEIVEVLNPLTNKIWMDRNLGASRAATTVVDEMAFGDLYQWGRKADGHQCRNAPTTRILSSVNAPDHGDFILNAQWPHNWLSPIDDNLWQGGNGVNNPCPENFRLPTLSELSAELNSLQITSNLTAFNSPLKIPAAGRRVIHGNLDNVGSMAFIHTSTFTNPFSKALFLDQNAVFHNTSTSDGLSVRCIKENPSEPSISTLDCNAVIQSGAIIADQDNNNSFFEIPYTGGNGGHYHQLSIQSTGVTGLLATLPEGFLSYGNSKLRFMVTGNPATIGNAVFNIDFAGIACVIFLRVSANLSYPTGTVHCNSDGPTDIVEVLNPTTNRIWMDRNLGASRPASSISDALAYGDLYQWGRKADGHQCRNSNTVDGVVTSQPTHADFILNVHWPHHWLNPIDINYWQGANGVNNPCPAGFKVPTDAEFEDEIRSWSSHDWVGAFNSPLKFSAGGFRNSQSGNIELTGLHGNHWTSNHYYPYGKAMSISSHAAVVTNSLGYGFSIRCIKENQ